MANDNQKLDFHLADDQGYILARGHRATARLNLQHFLWRESLGFTLHPSIDVAGDVAVADVAAGTCLYAADLAHSIPSATVKCFDIDITQAPPQKWLPPRVTSARWNILEEPPADLLGTFDIVHTRLLVLVLSGLDPMPVIHRFKRLLKPGGYLQWDELDCVNMHVRKVDYAVEAPALDQLYHISRSDGRHDWTLQLPDILREGGFESVELHHFGDPAHLARAFNDLNMMTMEEFAAGIIGIGKQDAGANVLRVVNQAHEESLKGATLCIPRVVCVARTPH